jgi:hypothetical protein
MLRLMAFDARTECTLAPDSSNGPLRLLVLAVTLEGSCSDPVHSELLSSVTQSSFARACLSACFSFCAENRLFLQIQR